MWMPTRIGGSPSLACQTPTPTCTRIAITSTSSVSSHTGDGSSRTRTIVQSAALARMIVITIHERRTGKRPVRKPMTGPDASVASTPKLITPPAAPDESPCAFVR